MDPQEQQNQIRRVTWIGMAANVLLAAAKFVIGTLGSSQAIIADGFHSLSDCASDIVILVGVRYWSKPADADHPHGHQRIETVIEVVVGLMLASVAVGLVYNALRQLHVRHETNPSPAALVAAVIAIVVKEALYRWTAREGKRLRSPAVVANAWHHRSDAISSIPAGLAVAGTAINPSWGFLDHIGALVVSLFIMHAAFKIVRPALDRLTDRGAPREDVVAMQRMAEAVPGVVEVHALRTRYMGSGLQVDLHVLVDGDRTVRDGHEIATRVKYTLIESDLDVIDAVVHLEPEERSRQMARKGEPA